MPERSSRAAWLIQRVPFGQRPHRPQEVHIIALRRAAPATLAQKISLQIAIVLIGMATLLGMVVAGTNVPNIDLRISRHVQQWQGNVPETLQRLGDAAGGTASAIIALITLLVVTLIARWRLDATFILVVALFRLVGFALKDIYDSPRPTEDLVTVLRHYNHTGYPSGHSMTMAMMATTVTILAWRHTDATMARGGSIVIGTMLTLMVGWSRIWAGAHWPSDILGGWMYGVGFVLLAAWIAYRAQPDANADQSTSKPAR